MSISAASFFPTEEVYSVVGHTYGIPTEILYTLDEEYVHSLYNAMQNNPSSIQTYEIYCTDEIDSEGSVAPRGVVGSDERPVGPMKIRLTIMEIDSDTFQISAAFDWQQMPGERMHDIISLGCSDGVVWADSTDGFYTHTNHVGRTTTLNFVEETPNSSRNGIFSEHRKGVVGEFNLIHIDEPPRKDYAFIRTNITREGTGESVYAEYAHQTVNVSIDFDVGVSDGGGLEVMPLPTFTQAYKTYQHYRHFNF